MANQNLPKRARWVRALLVVVVNGYFASSQIVEILHTRAARRVDPVVHFDPGPPTASDFIFIVPLLVGIILEFVSWRFARVVNVGYYGLLSVYMVIGYVLAEHGLFGYDLPEHWAIGIIVMGVPSAVFALLLWWLYRRSRPAAAT